MSIGITRSPEPNELTVDAAVVNPWVASPVAAPEPVATPAATPKPAAPIIASNAEILASLPSRFGRNIYGDVAVSFRPGSARHAQGNPTIATNGHTHPNGQDDDTQIAPPITLAPLPPYGTA
jgi:hypothetical protein